MSEKRYLVEAAYEGGDVMHLRDEQGEVQILFHNHDSDETKISPPDGRNNHPMATQCLEPVDLSFFAFLLGEELGRVIDLDFDQELLNRILPRLGRCRQKKFFSEEAIMNFHLILRHISEFVICDNSRYEGTALGYQLLDSGCESLKELKTLLEQWMPSLDAHQLKNLLLVMVARQYKLKVEKALAYCEQLEQVEAIRDRDDGEQVAVQIQRYDAINVDVEALADERHEIDFGKSTLSEPDKETRLTEIEQALMKLFDERERLRGEILRVNEVVSLG